CVDGFVDSQPVAIVIQFFELEHATQNPVATLYGACRIGNWVHGGGCFGNARQHGQLGGGQFMQGFPVINIGGGFDTVSTVPQKNNINVQLKNFLFCEFSLNS